MRVVSGLPIDKCHGSASHIRQEFASSLCLLSVSSLHTVTRVSRRPRGMRVSCVSCVCVWGPPLSRLSATEPAPPAAGAEDAAPLHRVRPPIRMARAARLLQLIMSEAPRRNRHGARADRDGGTTATPRPARTRGRERERVAAAARAPPRDPAAAATGRARRARCRLLGRRNEAVGGRRSSATRLSAEAEARAPPQCVRPPPETAVTTGARRKGRRRGEEGEGGQMGPVNDERRGACLHQGTKALLCIT